MTKQEFATQVINDNGGSFAFSRLFKCTPAQVCNYKNKGFTKPAMMKLELLAELGMLVNELPNLDL